MSCREYFVSFPRLKPAPAALCINFAVWSHGLHLLSEEETREGQRVLGGREEEGAGVFFFFFFFFFVFLNSRVYPGLRKTWGSRPHSKWSQTTASPKMAASPPISSRSQAQLGHLAEAHILGSLKVSPRPMTSRKSCGLDVPGSTFTSSARAS